MAPRVLAVRTIGRGQPLTTIRTMRTSTSNATALSSATSTSLPELAKSTTGAGDDKPLALAAPRAVAIEEKAAQSQSYSHSHPQLQSSSCQQWQLPRQLQANVAQCRSARTGTRRNRIRRERFVPVLPVIDEHAELAW